MKRWKWRRIICSALASATIALAILLIPRQLESKLLSCCDTKAYTAIGSLLEGYRIFTVISMLPQSFVTILALLKWRDKRHEIPYKKILRIKTKRRISYCSTNKRKMVIHLLVVITLIGIFFPMSGVIGKASDSNLIYMAPTQFSLAPTFNPHIDKTIINSTQSSAVSEIQTHKSRNSSQPYGFLSAW